MRKILLIYEDFNELTSLESSLKKGGFDVIGLSTEYSLQEKMLSFNPDIVIASGRGPKVSTISVGKKLKDMTRWNGKSILIFPSGVKPNPQDLIRARMDLILESPIPLPRMVQILAKFTGLSEQTILDKINKVSSIDIEPSRVSSSNYNTEPEGSVFVKGSKRDKDDTRIGSLDSDATESHRLGDEDSEDEDLESMIRAMQGTGADPNVPKTSGRSEKKSQSSELFKAKEEISKSEEVNKSKKTEFSLNENSKLESENLKSEKQNTEKSKLKNSKAEKSKDPFEQIANELSADKPQFKFDLDSPFSDLEKKDNKKFEVLELKNDNQSVSGKPSGEDQNLSKNGFKVDESSGFEKLRSPILDEIEQARKNSAARQARYNQQLKGAAPVAPKSTLQDRKAIKKAFKELSKDWNQDDLKEQDRLRREFAAAMFKKTR